MTVNYAQDDPSRFVMPVIESLKPIGIEKDKRGFLEAHSVFAAIGGILVRVPIEPHVALLSAAKISLPSYPEDS